jgi:hypothetical protein
LFVTIDASQAIMDHGTHTTSMPMPTSGMDDGMAMRMDATFFTSTTTPLWSTSFAPSNVGQYAGMCVFLIAFATIFRLLVALRMNFFQFASSFRRSSDRGHLLQPQGVASVEVEEYDKTVRRPWNATEAAVLGVVDVIIAGVSYLL